MHILIAVLAVLTLVGVCSAGEATVPMPRIVEPWWPVAGNPDLGHYTSPKQQPVDFAVWQAADGTWQLWSCIRHTTCGGNTRLFYRWEGKNLTGRDWTPMGIAMMADPERGEAVGGMQAPHVVVIDGVWHMLYGDWNRICLATSKDGKTFTRVNAADGSTGLFTEGQGANTRDAMALLVGDLWHCYYTAFPGRKGSVYCRTSRDLRSWSDATIVAFGGSATESPFSAECPHTVCYDDHYYLFRTQRYGQNSQTSVYRSTDPLKFGVRDDHYLVCRLPIAAPEIVVHEGQWYLAALNPGLDGIRIAKLSWEPGTPLGDSLWQKPAPLGKALFDLDDAAERGTWRLVEGDIDPIFTTSTRQAFEPPFTHFIGTAEAKGGKLDDGQKGVIESPVVTLDALEHVLVVSGGKDEATCHVALIDAESGKELARHAGTDSNTFRQIPIDTSRLRSRKVKVRVVDRATGGWGHINFGGLFEAKGE